jgi:hypothetical protein
MIDNNYLYFLIFISLLYTYYTKKIIIPNIIIDIYKNPIFKIIFLFTLLVYGKKNIPITIFFAINWVGLSHQIQEQELLNNI